MKCSACHCTIFVKQFGVWGRILLELLPKKKVDLSQIMALPANSSMHHSSTTCSKKKKVVEKGKMEKKFVVGRIRTCAGRAQ